MYVSGTRHGFRLHKSEFDALGLWFVLGLEYHTLMFLGGLVTSRNHYMK